MASATSALAPGLLLASVLYVMIQLPPAGNQDLFPPAFYIYGSQPVISGFWGSGLAGWFSGGGAVKYGAGWGWYALTAGSGSLLVDGVLRLRRVRTQRKAQVPGRNPA